MFENLKTLNEWYAASWEARCQMMAIVETWFWERTAQDTAQCIQTIELWARRSPKDRFEVWLESDPETIDTQN